LVLKDAKLKGMNHLPFPLSIAVLSLVQGAAVALARPPALLPGARRRLLPLALLPALSIAAFVAGIRIAPEGAEVIVYLALVAVPLLAAVAFALLVPGARPPYAFLALVCFTVAWVDREGPFGEVASLALIVASCVTLGSALALLTPPLPLGLGLVVMATADTALIIAEQLQRPNGVLDAARPAFGLPQLQAGVFGSAVIGYGDLFAAATLGALVGLSLGHRRQLVAAAATAVFALAFDLLFFFASELPATVPVAASFLAVAFVPLREQRRNQQTACGVSRADGTKGRKAKAPGLHRSPTG
jgi:hypothetical protein